MMSFRNDRLASFGLSGATLWLLGEVSEFKGKQELYARQSPQVLKALREHALIQSAESSNRKAPVVGEGRGGRIRVITTE